MRTSRPTVCSLLHDLLEGPVGPERGVNVCHVTGSGPMSCVVLGRKISLCEVAIRENFTLNACSFLCASGW